MKRRYSIKASDKEEIDYKSSKLHLPLNVPCGDFPFYFDHIYNGEKDLLEIALDYNSRDNEIHEQWDEDIYLATGGFTGRVYSMQIPFLSECNDPFLLATSRIDNLRTIMSDKHRERDNMGFIERWFSKDLPNKIRYNNNLDLGQKVIKHSIELYNIENKKPHFSVR